MVFAERLINVCQNGVFLLEVYHLSSVRRIIYFELGGLSGLYLILATDYRFKSFCKYASIFL